MRKYLFLGLMAVLPLQATTYFHDDGTGESGFGGFNADILHLVAFTSQAGAETIGSIQVAFGELNGTGPANGTAVTAYFWSDPNDDGNPDDAVLLDSVAGVVAGQSTNTFVNFVLNAPITVPEGEVFFVGVRNNGRGTNSSVFLSYRDTNSTSGASWLINKVSADIDPSNLAGETLDQPENFFTPGGNFMIRAESVDIPEPGTMLLSLIGLSGLGLGRSRFGRRRR